MSASSAALFSSPLPSKKKKKKMKLILSSNRKSLVSVSAFKIGVEEIAELAHNKVLVASTLSCAIGQLSKSFTSAFNGDRIDLKAAVRSGGMPSVHSAGVVAAATSLALDSSSCILNDELNMNNYQAEHNLFANIELYLAPFLELGAHIKLNSIRGFSDSIFGMSVVFAALVMYDAQGVRREVGYHAKIVNELLKAHDTKSKSETYSLLKSGVTSTNLETLQSVKVDVKESSDKSQSSCSPLNESVGHTEIQMAERSTNARNSSILHPSSARACLSLAIEVDGGDGRTEIIELGEVTSIEILTPARGIDCLPAELMKEHKDKAVYA